MSARLATPCQADPDLWFSREGEHLAKAGCSRCPARLECLRAALEFEANAPILPSWGNTKGQVARYGVWGGLSPAERAQLSADTEEAEQA